MWLNNLNVIELYSYQLLQNMVCSTLVQIILLLTWYKPSYILCFHFFVFCHYTQDVQEVFSAKQGLSVKTKDDSSCVSQSLRSKNCELWISILVVLNCVSFCSWSWTTSVSNSRSNDANLVKVFFPLLHVFFSFS